MTTATTRRTPAHYRGCLLGGAVGDALGAPVEFLDLAAIRATYGPDGIADFDEEYGRVGAITDDTQMTLFTAEGLLRALARWSDRGIWNPAAVVHRAYLRWLHTQGMEPLDLLGSDPVDGWLVQVPELHARRGPGHTCLSALRSGLMGTIERPINDSKGCGGIMRAAPVGLVANEANVFRLGCETAAITHGHPSGYLAAGVRLAVNHSGDSDSTGAITGNILGALLGEDAIPEGWRERVELRDTILRLADDLFAGWSGDIEWMDRYPGW